MRGWPLVRPKVHFIVRDPIPRQVLVMGITAVREEGIGHASAICRSGLAHHEVNGGPWLNMVQPTSKATSTGQWSHMVE